MLKKTRGWRLCLLLSAGVMFGGCRSADEGGWTCAVRVRPLTFGPGNDTEAAWSPDNGRIVFQSDRGGDLDVVALGLADGALTVVAGGPGHACYPAWTPDGGVVYALSRPVETAAQGAAAKTDNGCNLWLWREGETRRLTRGRWRDYTPWVAPDGGTVYFASTRGYTAHGNGAYIARLALAADAEPQKILELSGFGTNSGAVSPSCSPDGKMLLWAQLDGPFSNWRLCAAKTEARAEFVYLTPGEMSAYSPRWSPDGRLIAFTGFRRGDPGWGVYLTETRSGAMTRLETGPGHSKNPAWSPDGRNLVFENNRTGVYKLYRAALHFRRRPPSVLSAEDHRMEPRVEARLERRGAEATLAGADGRCLAASAQTKDGMAVFEGPPGLDFGDGPFFVRVSFMLDRHRDMAQIVVSGQYRERLPGWQIFIRPNGRICFGARTPDDELVAVEAWGTAQTGVVIEALGVRVPDGTLRLYIDGALENMAGVNAYRSYGPASRVVVGGQAPGDKRLYGRVLTFECGRGYPEGVPAVLTRTTLFEGR
jgi:TolB protein